jgi:hypothetical protein
MGNPKSEIMILRRQGVQKAVFYYSNRVVIASLERYLEQLPCIPGGILTEACGLEIQVRQNQEISGGLSQSVVVRCFWWKANKTEFLYSCVFWNSRLLLSLPAWNSSEQAPHSYIWHLRRLPPSVDTVEPLEWDQL